MTIAPMDLVMDAATRARWDTDTLIESLVSYAEFVDSVLAESGDDDLRQALSLESFLAILAPSPDPAPATSPSAMVVAAERYDPPAAKNGSVALEATAEVRRFFIQISQSEHDVVKQLGATCSAALGTVLGQWLHRFEDEFTIVIRYCFSKPECYVSAQLLGPDGNRILSLPPRYDGMAGTYSFGPGPGHPHSYEVTLSVT
jgi:hypothetical protein